MLEINAWSNDLFARMRAYNVFFPRRGSHFKLYVQRPPLLLWSWKSCEATSQQHFVGPTQLRQRPWIETSSSYGCEQ